MVGPVRGPFGRVSGSSKEGGLKSNMVKRKGPERRESSRFRKDRKL